MEVSVLIRWASNCNKPNFSRTFSYEIVIKIEYSYPGVWLYNFSVKSDQLVELKAAYRDKTYRNLTGVRDSRPFYYGNRDFGRCKRQSAR